MSAEQVLIQRLGNDGDGVADTEDGVVYVPFTLPGERPSIARTKSKGTMMSLTEPSPDRVAPLCPHFGPDGEGGTCGGCSLQHASDAVYQDFKRQIVVNALKSKGLQAEVQPLITALPGQRRRAVFTARNTEKELLLGFNQAASHHIVSIRDCRVITPGILNRLASIRRIGRALSTNAEPFRITVLETLSGLDIAVDGIIKIGDKQRRAGIETTLSEKGVARVSIDGEILIEPIRPVLNFGTVPVSPPSGGFTQATLEAENAMADVVLGLVGKAKRVADLFAGSGTFSLRLAKAARVHAVESDEKALKALDFAARNSQGLKPVSIERRDLFRRPMMAQELKAFDAVVFDPPRAGAEFQAQELARSSVKTIVAVSCSPTTLARDLSILTEAGYKLTTVTPIDQFLWSSHVEVVAGLVK